jgi:hypothetical protein
MLVLIVFPIAISYGIFFQSLGMDQAFMIAEREWQEERVRGGEQPIQFAVDGPRTYQYFTYHFGVIAFCLLVCGAIWLTETVQPDIATGIKYVLEVGTLLLLICGVWHLMMMLRDASFLEPWVLQNPRNNLARVTFTWDWILLTFTTVLTGLHLYSVGVALFRGRQSASKVLS